MQFLTVQFFAIPWTVACLSMGFPRQEYWSGLPFPFPGDLPVPGIEPGPPALRADSLPELQGKPNLDSILKSRDMTLLMKVHIVKAMVFPIVMYGCESWTVKKAERRIIDAFELLEKTLESPLDCKEIKSVSPKGNQH